MTKLEIIKPGRGTGNTFRQLLEATMHARAGENVEYCSQTPSAMDYSFTLLADMVLRHARVNKTKRTIEFEGGGRVHFSVNDDRANERRRGQRGLKTMWDHYRG